MAEKSIDKGRVNSTLPISEWAIPFRSRPFLEEINKQIGIYEGEQNEIKKVAV